MALIEFDTDDYALYVDYQTALYDIASREEFSVYKELFVSDSTFSAGDVIRIYSNYLTLSEQAEVKEFFLKIIPGLITDIYNNQVWENPTKSGLSQEEAQVKIFSSITLWDLLVRTTSLVYDMLDAIKDIVTLDLLAFIRLKTFYERLVALSQDWYAYWQRTYSTPYSIEGNNRDGVWWMW